MFQTKEQNKTPGGGEMSWSGCNLFYSVQSNHHKDAHQTEKNWEFQQRVRKYKKESIRAI